MKCWRKFSNWIKHDFGQICLKFLVIKENGPKFLVKGYDPAGNQTFLLLFSMLSEVTGGANESDFKQVEPNSR